MKIPAQNAKKKKNIRKANPKLNTFKTQHNESKTDQQ